jgi:hypothetical protein
VENNELEDLPLDEPDEPLLDPELLASNPAAAA